MLPTIPILEQPHIEPIQLVIKEEKKEPKLYTIKEGQTLTAIATENNTTVERLWEKNLDLKDPDVIDVNFQLTIPLPDEELPDRPLPAKSQPEPIKNVPRLTSGGGYAAGYCTAYAWSRRPDLPGNLGNADSWGIRAAAQGFTVNNTPSVGSVGVARSYMHVVYIEQVDGDRVFVSEQNYVGWGVVSSRWTSASEFTYIH